MEANFDQLAMPEASASVLDRIKYLIKLSRHTQNSFSKLLGLDPASLSRVLSGKSKPSESLINRIVVNLGVSKDWLVRGTDVPFPRSTESRRQSATAAGAPVYNIDVTAGAVPLSRMFTAEHVVGHVMLPGINPELPIVRVSGDSMKPRLNPGCYISIRPVAPDAPIVWGSIYVVVLPDFRFVKYVRRNADPELVTLHSENPDYDDIEIRRADIEALYKVENVINHDLI